MCKEVVNKKIMLEGINEVKEFVKIVSSYPDVEAELQTGRYSVDAKSIMGIFSLDLTAPLTLIVHESPSQNALLEEIKEFFCE